MRSTRCELQSGLFVLRICGRDAVGACSECGRSYCSKHAAPVARAAGLCLACAEKRGVLHDEDHRDDWRRHVSHRDRNRIDPWHWNDRNRSRDRADDRDDAAAATTAGAAAFTAEEMSQFDDTQAGAAGDGLAEDPAESFDSPSAGEADDMSIFDS